MTYLRECRIVFARSMRLSLRNLTWVVMGLTQPILYVVLFGPLLVKLGASLGGDPWQVFVPGMLVQLGMFGAMFVGFSLIGEYRAGVIESERVTPASRSALLVGRVARDVVVLIVQAVLLILVAIPFGFRAPIGGVLIGLLLVGLLGASFASLSYAAALNLKSEDALAPVLNSLIAPLLLLSGIMLPMSLAPKWLQVVSDVNPLKHVVEGARAVFRGDIATSATAWGLGWTVVLVVAGTWVGTRVFRSDAI